MDKKRDRPRTVSAPRGHDLRVHNRSCIGWLPRAKAGSWDGYLISFLFLLPPSPTVPVSVSTSFRAADVKGRGGHRFVANRAISPLQRGLSRFQETLAHCGHPSPPVACVAKELKSVIEKEPPSPTRPALDRVLGIGLDSRRLRNGMDPSKKLSRNPGLRLWLGKNDRPRNSGDDLSRRRNGSDVREDWDNAGTDVRFRHRPKRTRWSNRSRPDPEGGVCRKGAGRSNVLDEPSRSLLTSDRPLGSPIPVPCRDRIPNGEPSPRPPPSRAPRRHYIGSFPLGTGSLGG